MNKRILLSILLLLGGLTLLSAQNRYKLNLALHLEMQKMGNSDQQLPLLVKGNLNAIETATRQADGTYKYGVGNIASISMPINKIKQFSSNAQIDRIEYSASEAVLLNDFVGPMNNLDSLHQGLGNLPQEVQGEGVIVGVIDTGIEWKHPDFINEDGTTRIQYIWDQVDSCVISPSGYSYGCEWNSNDIEDDNLSHNPSSGGAHGTKVTGLAAGNGRAANGYVGGAPKAEIISVRIKSDGGFYEHFVDAVYYIFEKADELGKPCVINSSVGAYRGPHDSSELATKLIENILDAKPGRILVQAAGNAGDDYGHLSYPVTADTAFSWFRYTSVVGGIGFDLYADTAELNQVWFGMGARDRNDNSYFGNTRFYNILEDMDLSMTNPIDSIVDSLVYNGINKGSVKIFAELVDDFYYLYYKVVPTNSQDHWELQTTGSGLFHIWSHRWLIGTSRIMEPGVVPDVATLPAMVNYRFPDLTYSIVSGWNCSEKVVSVANYQAGDFRTTYAGDTVYNIAAGGIPNLKGDRVSWSSKGPTRKGLQKPNIAATGNFTYSATSLERLDDFRISDPSRVAPEGWHVLFSGTSASAPVVAGAVACYLELFPNATSEQVIAALESTAKVDSFVVNGYPSPPNIFWGYGKLDAFNFISQAVVYGCTDPIADNYNPLATFEDGSCQISGCTDSTATNYDPLANVDDGSCQISGCTDSTATNYDPLANVDDGSCEFPVGIDDIDGNKTSLFAAPNPFKEQVTIEYNIQELGERELILTDVTGKRLQSKRLGNKSGSLTILRNELLPGVYFLSLAVDDKIILTEKIILLQ